MSGLLQVPFALSHHLYSHFVIVCSWLFSSIASPSSKSRRSKGISGTKRRYHQRVIGASRSTAGGIDQITICQWQFVGNSQQTEKRERKTSARECRPEMQTSRRDKRLEYRRGRRGRFEGNGSKRKVKFWRVRKKTELLWLGWKHVEYCAVAGYRRIKRRWKRGKGRSGVRYRRSCSTDQNYVLRAREVEDLARHSAVKATARVASYSVTNHYQFCHFGVLVSMSPQQWRFYNS
jgi:hypothetical protein